VKKPRLQHRAEYALLRVVESGMAGLGPSAADRLGEALGALVQRPIGIRRGVVAENLRRAFPGADESWIEATTAAAYRHLGREVAAMLRLSTLDRAAVRELVEIPGETWAALEEALAEGRGAILATGHYGNWEMAAAAVAARGRPIEAIVKRMANPLVDRRIEQARRALGVETVGMRQALRLVPRALAAGKTVGIVADQDARNSGVWVPFFGVPASTHRGPALFALRTRAPLFAAVARRLPDGRYHLHGDRIDTARTGSFDADLIRITTALAAHLEQEIRKDPTQYFWFHKRWKTPPPEELVTEVTGTRSHDGPGEFFS
jgi:KDO2-lipid IV(A) lauroyltransferase